MKEAQDLLDMLVSEGYSSADIADKLDSVGIEYTLEDDKFNLVDNEEKPMKKVAVFHAEELSTLPCMSDMGESTTVRNDFHDTKFNKEV